MRTKSDVEYIGNTTKPGNPLWDEYKDPTTGKSTLQIHDPVKISNFEHGEHYWNLIDNNGNIQCKTCGLGMRIVWGMEFVKDGKILKTLGA